jgi:hypothetical protein
VTRDATATSLSFGSFWSGLKLIQLNPATGKRIAPDSPMYSLAHQDAIEAPFIHRHGAHYYLFINWGICCRGTNSTAQHPGRAQRKHYWTYLDKAGLICCKAAALSSWIRLDRLLGRAMRAFFPKAARTGLIVIFTMAHGAVRHACDSSDRVGPMAGRKWTRTRKCRRPKVKREV